MSGAEKTSLEKGQFLGRTCAGKRTQQPLLLLPRTEPEKPDFVSEGAQGKAKESLRFSPEHTCRERWGGPPRALSRGTSEMSPSLGWNAPILKFSTFYPINICMCISYVQ